MAWSEKQIVIAVKANGTKTLYQLEKKIGKDAGTIRRFLDRHKIPYLLVRQQSATHSDETIKKIQDLLSAGGQIFTPTIYDVIFGFIAKYWYLNAKRQHAMVGGRYATSRGASKTDHKRASGKAKS